VKITFFVFLSIYSRCGATVSWAALHTTIHLDALCNYIQKEMINHACMNVGTASFHYSAVKKRQLKRKGSDIYTKPPKSVQPQKV